MSEKEMNNRIVNTVSSQSLIQDLRQIIEQARGRVAATANYELTMMYWHIGERINREVLEISALSMVSKLCRQCHDNCKRRMGRKGLRKEPSAE